MTNYEHYQNELMEILANGTEFAVSTKGKVVDCGRLSCDDCIFDKLEVNGEDVAVKQKWLKEEYVERGVKASTLPVDTKVICWDIGNNDKRKRYFSRVDENGYLFAFIGGKTSWSIRSIESDIHWDCMTLEDGTPIIAE